MTTDMFPDDSMSSEEFADAMREQAVELGTEEMDIQTKLARLDELAELRRKDPRIEKEYELLRNELVSYLNEAGPVYYLDNNHAKRFAWPVQPEKLIVDVEKLVEMADAGEIDVDLDKVAPRRVDTEELKAAVAKKKIPPREFLKMARLEPGTGHVRFSDPQDTGH
jgi:hypothetical protein